MTQGPSVLIPRTTNKRSSNVFPVTNIALIISNIGVVGESERELKRDAAALVLAPPPRSTFAIGIIVETMHYTIF